MKVLVDAIPMAGLLTGIARYLRNLYGAMETVDGVDLAYYRGGTPERDLPSLAPSERWQQTTGMVRKLPDPEAVTSVEVPSDPLAPAAFVYTTEQVEEPDWGTDYYSEDDSVSGSRETRMVDRIEATDPRASGLLRSTDNRTQLELGDAALLV